MTQYQPPPGGETKPDPATAHIQPGFYYGSHDEAEYVSSVGIKGMSIMKLQRDLGITQKTAGHVAHRIRETWHECMDTFAELVEVDEMDLGWREKNKHRGQETAGWTIKPPSWAGKPTT